MIDTAGSQLELLTPPGSRNDRQATLDEKRPPQLS